MLKQLLSTVTFLAWLTFPCLAHEAEHHDEESAQDHALILSALERNRVTVEIIDGQRHITANGIPDHVTGRFPNRNNPNTISPQSYRFVVPAEPALNEEPQPLRRTLFGVALNGIPFDPATAENWTPNGLRRGGPPSDWVYDALSGKINLGIDPSNAHVQPTGAYHYHGIPNGLLQQLQKPGQPTLLGYAADGFPIYGPMGYTDPHDADSPLKPLQPSYSLKPGQRPANPQGPGGNHDGTFTQDWQYVEGLGDLDACNGRTGVTPEYPQGTYHYVLTERFPFVPRLLHGTADPSFQHQGPPPGAPGGPGNRPRGEGPPPQRPS